MNCSGVCCCSMYWRIIWLGTLLRLSIRRCTGSCSPSDSTNFTSRSVYVFAKIPRWSSITSLVKTARRYFVEKRPVNRYLKCNAFRVLLCCFYKRPSIIRSMKRLQVHPFRFDPISEQQPFMRCIVGSCYYVWNTALSLQIDYHEVPELYINHFALCKWSPD